MRSVVQLAERTSNPSTVRQEAGPSLDLLLPAYEYAAGVAHILDSLVDAPRGIRVLIGDDSVTDEVENCVMRHAAFGRVHYRRNTPALGAIKNWNDLLARSKKEYIMILHHDEWPLQPDFFRQLSERLKDKPDILVLDVLVRGFRKNSLRRHVPRWLTKFIVNRFPSYLLRRNVIGAPSALVLRRDLAVEFDTRVPWMVDVDWYCRILSSGRPKSIIFGEPALVSLPHLRSITGSLGGSLERRQREESIILLGSHKSKFWLRINAPTCIVLRLAAFLERLWWYSMRVATTLWLSVVTHKPIPTRYR